MKKCVALLSLLSLVFLASVAMAQPRPMEDDIYNPLTKGYDFMRAGNYEAAEFEFQTVLTRDRYNPFALNNLAASAVQKGKLKEGMAFLVDAQTNAKD